MASARKGWTFGSPTLAKDEGVISLPKPNSTRLILKPDTWFAAAVLGALRVAVNDPFRANDRDSKEAGNVQNDLQGALGELVCLQYLESKNVTNIRHNALDLHRPVNEADFVGEVNGKVKSFEAKCELAEQHKSYFLINDRAHTRSKNRGADCYIPIFTSLGADQCLIGSSIKIDDVSKWQVGYFGKRRDPARYIRLAEAAQSYFGLSAGALKAPMLKSAYHSAKQQDIAPFAIKRKEMLAAVRANNIDLSDLSYTELVRTLLEIAEQAQIIHLPCPTDKFVN